MPNQANITIKAADGTTDVVYTALTPAAGDRTPARWANISANARANLRPTAEMTSRFNNARSARHVDFVLKYPEVASVNGVDQVVGTALMSATCVVPLQVTDSVIAEAVAQFGHLLNNALVSGSVKAGYAPQ